MAYRTIVQKFGRNDTVGNNTWEDVWSRGGVYVWPQTAGKLNVSSDAAGDAAAGAGARTITVEGLDANFDATSETITMTGLSTTTGTVDFVRVDRAYVATAGTYATLTAGANAGTININTTAAVAVASIGLSTGGATVSFGQTELARYTVPRNRIAYIHSISLHVDSAQAADVAFFQRRNADDITAPLSPKRLVAFFDGVDRDRTLTPPHPWGPFPGKTDLWFAAKGAGGATAVEVQFTIEVLKQTQ